MDFPMVIRPCNDRDAASILRIVNAAAEAYRGVIPDDRWREPYMGADELRGEIAAGVAFSACQTGGEMVGVMGIQPVRNVHLIRHAYVLPEWQGRGIGRRLMEHLRATNRRQVLVGTWAAATWAIRFYELNGFRLVDDEAKALLLRTYWTIPDRQVEVSVVLAAPALTLAEARKLAP
jgi:GNAT superfamily N-acetyltransferase